MLGSVHTLTLYLCDIFFQVKMPFFTRWRLWGLCCSWFLVVHYIFSEEGAVLRRILRYETSLFMWHFWERTDQSKRETNVKECRKGKEKPMIIVRLTDCSSLRILLVSRPQKKATAAEGWWLLIRFATSLEKQSSRCQLGLLPLSKASFRHFTAVHFCSLLFWFVIFKIN